MKTSSSSILHLEPVLMTKKENEIETQIKETPAFVSTDLPTGDSHQSSIASNKI
jgi:hypothetical protein